MENKDYIVGIDIGSSNIVMAVGVRDNNGEISVLGIEVQEVADCVKDGNIVNYIELGKTILKAKSSLEGELGRRLNSAYIGISGKSVYCVHYEDYVDISDKTGCVTENELRELQSRIDMVVPGGGDEIIARMPLRYRVDDRPDVKNPLGAFGRKLSATYLFVLVGKQQIELINRAMHQADIKICGLCVTPTVLHPLLLNDIEMEEGAMIVDIGGDLTDISIVREGRLWYFSSLPIGASSINRDLHDFLKISKKDVDKLKRKYGSATADGVPDNTTISVKMASHANKQILQRNIAEITEERLKDIASFVLRELKGAKYQSKIPCGAILTGGSAYLANIDSLFSRELGMEVRMGRMLNGVNEDSQQDIATYSQSAVVALLLYGAEHKACETTPGMVGLQPKEEKIEERPMHEVDIFSTQNETTVLKPTVELPKEEDAEPVAEENTNLPHTPSEREYVEKNDRVEDVAGEHHDDKVAIKDDNNGDSVAGGEAEEPRNTGIIDRITNWWSDLFNEDKYI